MRASAARTLSPGDSSAASISLHAAATAAALRCASGAWSGLQRLQGRKPAASASAVVAWKATFSGRAGRAAQEGRHYTPVVRTE